MCSPQARKKGGKRNENKCSLLRGVWITNRGSVQEWSSAQNTGEASEMTKVNMTEGSQRHTCRNGKG